MNGQATPLSDIVVTDPCVELIERVLADAKAGRIASVALIAVAPQGGVMTGYVGGQRGDLYVGTALLTQKILSDIATPSGQQPRILRPVVAG